MGNSKKEVHLVDAETSALLHEALEEWALLTKRADVWSYDLVDPSCFSQPERRGLVRSSFALIEVWVYALKQAALASKRGVETSDAERMLLRDKKPELANNGEAHEREAKLRFMDNVRFAVKAFAKLRGIKLQGLALDKERWGKFEDAAKIRDRLMHPKPQESLNVSDSDFLSVVSAVDWFVAFGRALMFEAGMDDMISPPD